MDLDYDKFNSLLQDSMSAEDLNYRVKLVEEIFRLWCYAKVTLITNGNGNGKSHKTANNNNSKKEDALDTDSTFKFSDNGRGPLFESIILANEPKFIGYNIKKDKFVIIHAIKFSP
jgi:hypothetical protein